MNLSIETWMNTIKAYFKHAHALHNQQQYGGIFMNITREKIIEKLSEKYPALTFVPTTVIKNTFEKDAIIMKNLKSNKVTLFNKKENKKILEFDFTGFPYLAFWSKKGAPFVCIEPWYNTTDKIDSNGKFEDKENILKLEPEQEFECSYKIKFEEE